jgi:hypothetical protein
MNYVQPDYRIPSGAGVSVQIENNRNPLNVTGPQVAYNQPGVAAPPAPVLGQLDNTSLGKSKHTFANGTVAST